VKLTVFHAADGDCLLLTSRDGRRALIDGGRTGTFRELSWPVLERLGRAKEEIDLVLVSHIDADHIYGILWLMKAVAAWTVYDYQTTDGKNPTFPKPAVARPPRIAKLWHNSWRAQLGDLARPIEALAGRVAEGVETGAFDLSTASPETVEMVDALTGLAQSIPEGVELRRVVDDETPVVRNAPFGDLVLLRQPPSVEKLGTTRLTVIGPARKHLEALREEWRKWLKGKPAGRGPETASPQETVEQGQSLGAPGADLAGALAFERAQLEQFAASLTQAAEVIKVTDPTKVTPPNRASITLLAEEGKRSCLLTGDAAEEEILEGLEAAGKIANGRFWCNVVKVPHHGSEYNLSETFARTVLGDDYVFCADGAHHNPDPSVVKTIVETRLAADPRPFTLWFNTSPARTLANRRKALRAAIKEATDAAATSSAVSVQVLDDAKPFFELTL
jgi:beta-lactamase superfamily II metal-dependent hydrolase